MLQLLLLLLLIFSYSIIRSEEIFALLCILIPLNMARTHVQSALDWCEYRAFFIPLLSYQAELSPDSGGNSFDIAIISGGIDPYVTFNNNAEVKRYKVSIHNWSSADNWNSECYSCTGFGIGECSKR